MNAAEIQKASNEEIIAEFLKRRPQKHGNSVSIVRRNKNTIVFLITEEISEGDKTWDDDTYVQVTAFGTKGDWDFYRLSFLRVGTF